LHYRESRPDYFSPADFWKHYLGVSYHGTLGAPGSVRHRDRWVEGVYLAGLDSERVRYHSGRVGFIYETGSGIRLEASGTLTRSSVFTSGGLRFAIHLQPFGVP
jgi:hypothetical protein